MIRIIVADDHALVRAGLCQLLESKPDFEVVADTGSGRESINLCREHKPDILLLDLELPDIDGLEVTSQLAASSKEVKVLILTMHDSEHYAVRLIQAGASGFIVKGSSPRELPDAIRKVASGENYISTPVMQKIVMMKNNPGQDPVSNLSDRELQVFTRLARGNSLQEICDELSLSPSTVGTYKKRILEKLDLRNVSDLTRLALRYGFINTKF